MNKKIQAFKYLLSDLFSSAISWTLFFIFRKTFIESQKYGFKIPIQFNETYLWAVVLIPMFWVFLYYLSGYYKNPYKKSRLQELGLTFGLTLLGSIILFFVLILDDQINNYKNYYFSFTILFLVQFILTYIPRLIITTHTNHRIQNRKIGFNTLIIGSNNKAKKLYRKLESQTKSAGYNFVGFTNVADKENFKLERYLKRVGSIKDLRNVIIENKIEEIIIAIETYEHEQIQEILTSLGNYNVSVKAIPDMYDVLLGKVKMSSLFGEPLIQISHELMPPWQIHMKRFIDVAFSLIAIILFLPLYIFLIIGVKLSSKGPIFYSHQRIGRYGKPFSIYKFRSMYVDSEKSGPALSSTNDSRITKFGKFMRKSRLDEIPQFFNVIIGDMSLVGPRPERQFFLDQIYEKAPYVLHLQKVRPGITSWGQVKFGYAENVDEMIERLQYDIVYIENMSLYVDFKIMIYTIKIIMQIQGK